MAFSPTYSAEERAGTALTQFGSLLHIVGVGMEKCGSSTIHDLLELVPDVATPSEKETYFFNEHLMKGPDWYHGLYSFTGKEKAFLDFTPLYFRELGALEAIREFPTQKRIIMMLRNPVKRAFSFYQHDIRMHMCEGSPVHRRKKTWQLFEPFELDFSFENMWKLQPPYYFHPLAGRLETIFQLFGRDAVMVIPLESFYADTDSWLERLEMFLDVDLSAVKGRPLPHSNKGSLPLFEKRKSGFLKRTCELYLTVDGKERKVEAPSEQAMDNVLKLQAGWTEKLDPALAHEIYHSHYKEDVARLEDLAGLDLSRWEEDLSLSKA
ncbi:sulfotransferase domain-containing protein [Rhodovibrionaceae bacterium A322]